VCDPVGELGEPVLVEDPPTGQILTESLTELG
jgi:hypothetical protein